MVPGQSLNDLTSGLFKALGKELMDFDPDIVLVQGDTNSAFAGALAGFYHGCKIVHVEAGLRTYDNRSPFPEEMNRKLIGQIADWHFAPTHRARTNLLEEGIFRDKIITTGNTIIDALNYGLEKITTEQCEEVEKVQKILAEPKQPFLLATIHRRENQGEPIIKICSALREIAKRSGLQIIVPVHPNKTFAAIIEAELSGIPGIKLIDPVPYPGFLWLMQNCSLILTDSGGIQEEASGIGKHVILLRENTERAEAVTGGFVYKAGSNVDLIVKLSLELLEKKSDPVQKAVFGKGDASKKILEFFKDLQMD
ncbi:MAG: UDP-N-acetylglucosamine 2-epimerase (non-hydrolyzing) [Bacteroidetes bacterium]|nr:MAG: UDP-N-acetylglucosamine 2-epimerase (non-hydrolyzing) [Bacteroidota bacterium]